MIWDAFIANLGTVFGGIRRGSPGEVVEEVEVGDGGSLAVPVAREEAVASEDGGAPRAPAAHHAQPARAQRRRCGNNAPVSNRRQAAYSPPSDETNTRHHRIAARALVSAQTHTYKRIVPKSIYRHRYAMHTTLLIGFSFLYYYSDLTLLNQSFLSINR